MKKAGGRQRSHQCPAMNPFSIKALPLLLLLLLLHSSSALVHLRASSFSFSFLDAPARFGTSQSLQHHLSWYLVLPQFFPFLTLSRFSQLFLWVIVGSVALSTSLIPLTRACRLGIFNWALRRSLALTRGSFLLRGVLVALRRRLGTRRTVVLVLPLFTITRKRAAFILVSLFSFFFFLLFLLWMV